ncbi:hypothetical protein MPSEU_000218600 [Mayamaea pseudoterrestris]|nr:hypothetical protein MPSEU_000218600 [Mayamaea pseudoterrestris]
MPMPRYNFGRMARRSSKIKSGKRQRKQQRLNNIDGSSSSEHRLLLHKPLINVEQAVDTALLCGNRLVPNELSLLIGGYYRDCLAHAVQERIQVNYYELEAKTRFTRHAQALLQEIVLYMEQYKNNTSIVLAPTIHLLSSLFFANRNIKSDVFNGSIDVVLTAVENHPNELGFLLLEYLFAVFDSYVRNAQSPSGDAHPVVTWNSQCVKHLLDHEAAIDLVLAAAANLASSTSGNGKYTQADSLRIGWVVTKVFCIYLEDNSTSPHVDALPRFNEVSTSIGNTIEELPETD